jgi:hypothetical protein
MVSADLFFSFVLWGLETLNLEFQTFCMLSFSDWDSEIVMGKWAGDWQCCPQKCACKLYVHTAGLPSGQRGQVVGMFEQGELSEEVDAVA